MHNRCRIVYRHPRTGVAGLVILNAESEIAFEKVSLEAHGNVVTEILRPLGPCKTSTSEIALCPIRAGAVEAVGFQVVDRAHFKPALQITA